MRFSHTYLGVNLPQLPTVFTLNHSLTPIDTPQGGGNQQGGTWDLRPPRVIDKLEGTRMTPWSPFWSLIDLSWSTILTRSSTELPPTISIWMIHFFCRVKEEEEGLELPGSVSKNEIFFSIIISDNE